MELNIADVRHSHRAEEEGPVSRWEKHGRTDVRTRGSEPLRVHQGII